MSERRGADEIEIDTEGRLWWRGTLWPAPAPEPAEEPADLHEGPLDDLDDARYLHELDRRRDRRGRHERREP